MQDVFLKKLNYLFIDTRPLRSKDKKMPEINFADSQKKGNLSAWLKDSFFVILALVFVALYAAAFAGKLDPLKDNTMLIRLEPVIFILIGYYFGRHPSRQCEQTLKDEITRQRQITEAAQFAKAKSQEDRERLEEKIKNARTALKRITSSEQNPDDRTKTEALKTAFNILDS